MILDLTTSNKVKLIKLRKNNRIGDKLGSVDILINQQNFLIFDESVNRICDAF